MWDPALYLRYADERGRPFDDLVARIRADSPRRVVDVGCGPGNLTETLARRWPGARVEGFDSSEEMIAAARRRGGDVTFTVGDLRSWTPGDADVVVSNATLQWVPEHLAVLRRWLGVLRPGAWLGIQLPANADAPAHQALRAVAADGPWRDDLATVIRSPRIVRPVAEYAHLFVEAVGDGGMVDCWETTYLHLLPAGGPDHPVLTWLEGTALRPVRAALDERRWNEFRAALAPLLADAYPVQAGMVVYPFRRVFAVAKKSAP